jgi:hypothetical protein
MDEARKYAYRHLLFFAMNDIRMLRGIVSPPAHFVDPLTSGDWIRLSARAGCIAHWLHNLAGFSTSDFAGFDEDQFWREHERVVERHPDVSVYRELFESSIKRFGGPAGAV